MIQERYQNLQDKLSQERLLKTENDRAGKRYEVAILSVSTKKLECIGYGERRDWTSFCKKEIILKKADTELLAKQEREAKSQKEEIQCGLIL